MMMNEFTEIFEVRNYLFRTVAFLDKNLTVHTVTAFQDAFFEEAITYAKKSSKWRA